MKKAYQGFTLIEVTAVVMIMGIVSMVAFSGTFTDVNEQTEKDKIKDHLRYAQFKSLSNDVYYWRIEFVSPGPPDDDYYELSAVNKDDPTDVIYADLPGETSPPPPPYHTHKLGIKITADTVIFNEWGVPVDSSHVPITTDQTIKFSDGTTVIATIKKNTGYVE
jgi:prepilin-type N-terminal cleavage/methylation domain-containing protein